MRAVFLFKRDLRIKDNAGLSKAAEKHSEIIPFFIFDRDIINEIKAEGERLNYVVKSIENLSSKIKIYCLYGETKEALENLFKIAKPTHLYTSSSWTWSGKKRNELIKNLCKNYGIEYVEVFENLLVRPEKITPKKIFTHFYNEWIKKVELETNEINEFKVPDLPLPTIQEIKKRLKIKNYEIFKPEDCEKRLEKFEFEKYDKLRDFPGLDGSSKLSPCIRFGIISLRQIYRHANGRSEKFIRELCWREFWYHIAINFPETQNIEFQEKRRKISWENNERYINAFFEAKTGYPIVDAGIRQLIQEKWIHNRIRMILASFLTKVMNVDWRIGEKFFKEHLLDYDEVVNIGNWQWSASVGADPRPFRFFNPILQARRYDPDCTYIKKYIPELSNIPCDLLHDPLNNNLKYHKPIVNYYERVPLTRKIFNL